MICILEIKWRSVWQKDDCWIQYFPYLISMCQYFKEKSFENKEEWEHQVIFCSPTQRYWDQLYQCSWNSKTYIKIHRNHKYHWRLIWDFFDECFGIRQIWRRSRNWIQCYLDLLQCNDSYIYCRLFMFWIIWIQTVLLVTSRINNYTFVNLLKIGPRITCRFPQHQKVSFRSSMCRNRFWWWFSLQVDYMIEQIILWEAWSILVMSPVIKLAICWY